jgi:hypothetical protein
MNAHPTPAPRDLTPVAAEAAAAAPQQDEAAALADAFIPAPSWRRALDEAIEADPRGRKGVAERLGVSRPYVSRITTGHIPQASPKFIRRVVAVLQRVDCPHLGTSLPPADCRAYAERRYAQIGPFDVPHWRACRACPNNPLRAEAEAAGGAPTPQGAAK